MPTRFRKTRKLRGSRTHGWGQVGQHRASGHKGGLGVSGQLKHHFSSMLRDDPGHFGHDSMKPPRRGPPPGWTANVRDLDALSERHGSEGPDGSRTIDLAAAGCGKLLGGGPAPGGRYAVKVGKCTASAERKVEGAGGRILRG